MILHHCLQGTDEWRVARLGRATSSGAEYIISLPDLLGETSARKVGTKGRLDYALRLAVERRTGLPQSTGDGFTSAAIDRGVLLEPEIRDRYAARHPELDVREVGFVEIDETLGDSPDGLCYEVATGDLVGGVEIKAHMAEAHWAALALAEQGLSPLHSIPREHVRQVIHHLACVSGARWWDFVSDHPAMSEGSQIVEVRLWRDDPEVVAALDKYRVALVEFESQVAAVAATMAARAARRV